MINVRMEVFEIILVGIFEILYSYLIRIFFLIPFLQLLSCSVETVEFDYVYPEDL